MFVKGDYAGVVKQISTSMPKYKTSGNFIGVPWVSTQYAIAATQTGDPEFAVIVTDEALEQIHRPGWEERGALAEVLRARGLALAVLSRDSESETAFHEALEVARSQKAKSWELRSATDLAQFWSARGKRREAYELLRSVYDWFTEGFTTHDLIKAKTLMESLR